MSPASVIAVVIFALFFIGISLLLNACVPRIICGHHQRMLPTALRIAV
jgi:hypothetical protein